MSGDPGYPDDIRQYDSDPRSPFYVDKTESAEFEDERLEITKERICDLGGYHLEAFSEAPDEWAAGLAKLVIEWMMAPTGYMTSDLESDIGHMVAKQVAGYCTPTDEEVLEALEGDGCE